ncbi:MAG: acyltransferase [Verrucomicrobia bacterium]|nr:acyltransferase [Verrucomicrobiota bacterium]
MRSSTGVHYIALDHVRALAAFMVFSWHFTHGASGFPIPFAYTPAFFPFAVLDEGHTGVALFMTLSGYLFAKLLDGKRIRYSAFVWNRVLRLMPLLVVVILVEGIRLFLHGINLRLYVWSVLRGVLYPTLPNGGWSITVEFHYYLILPLFLWLLSKSRLLPLCIVAISIASRALLYQVNGDISGWAYASIVGRIDQFALGMLVFQFRSSIAGKHLLAVTTIVGFSACYWFFDASGGIYQNLKSPLWIVLPTLEAVAYAVGIAWYDMSFVHPLNWASKFLARIGEYSYSIYLLHFFVVFDAAGFVHNHIMRLDNFYVACLWSAVFFSLMVIPGYVSFRLIEGPFLKLRKTYVRTVAPKETCVSDPLPQISGTT